MNQYLIFTLFLHNFLKEIGRKKWFIYLFIYLLFLIFFVIRFFLSTFYYPHFVIRILSSAIRHPPSAAIRCAFYRDPYEKTMLIKKKKNPMPLLISSFDATIRVKRAFHPAPASRGFASHVFLV